MAEPPPIPVPYGVLVEQLRESHILLLELRRYEQSPEIQVCIEQVERARSRMFEALRALP
jgi:hypothetical protein